MKAAAIEGQPAASTPVTVTVGLDIGQVAVRLKTRDGRTQQVIMPTRTALTLADELTLTAEQIEQVSR